MSLTKKPVEGSTECGPPRVLVVLHADGYVETYADGVDVHVAVMPHMESPAGKRLADEYLSVALPEAYRDLYWPGLIEATGQVETIRPSDIARQQVMADLLRAADRAAKAEAAA